ncbi:MAG: 50S ribosomal protein L30 [bacterium]|nr:50S ribosomal protein L30 [bacterium]
MKSGSKIIVTQIRSVASRADRTYKMLNALGLGRIGKSKVHIINEAVVGMVNKVRHLVDVQESKK